MGDSHAWAAMIGSESIGRLDATPFLTRCREGSVTRGELREFVVQQYHYARHFPRYLCALLANIQDEQSRLRLIENLFEESGFAGGNGRTHSQIYREMMERMGIQMDREPIKPTTKALIDTMFGYCRNANPVVGMGALCLGAEAIVPHVYSQVVKGFRAVGENEENLEFFRLHIECDDDHAFTMLEMIESELRADGKQLLPLRMAARGTIEARCAFFSAIRSNENRRFSQVPGGVFYEQVFL